MTHLQIFIFNIIRYWSILTASPIIVIKEVVGVSCGRFGHDIWLQFMITQTNTYFPSPTSDIRNRSNRNLFNTWVRFIIKLLKRKKIKKQNEDNGRDGKKNNQRSASNKPRCGLRLQRLVVLHCPLLCCLVCFHHQMLDVILMIPRSCDAMWLTVAIVRYCVRHRPRLSHHRHHFVHHSSTTSCEVEARLLRQPTTNHQPIWSTSTTTTRIEE